MSAAAADESSDEAQRRPGPEWAALGLVLAALLLWVAFQYRAWLVVGLFTYYLGRPVARRLRPRVGSGGVAAALTLGFIVVPVLGFLVAFVYVTVGQALAFLSSDAVSGVVADLPVPTTDLPTDPVSVVGVVAENPAVSSVLGEFGVAVGAFTAALFNLGLMLVFAFFLLAEDWRLAAWGRETLVADDDLRVDYLRRVDRGLTSVYFGYSLTIFAIVLMAAVVYLLFNLVAPGGLEIPSVLLLAALTGVVTLIPLVGRSIVYLVVVLLLASQAVERDPTLLWVPLVFFVLMVGVFDTVVRTYVRPVLSGQRYHLALVTFAYLLGPALFGWYGIFMGPFLMVVLVEFLDGVLPQFTGPSATDAASRAPRAVPRAETGPEERPADAEEDGEPDAGPAGERERGTGQSG